MLPIVMLGDEALMIQGNRSDGYASIVASEQRAELFERIGTLECDNIRLKGMLCVERYYNDAEREDPISPWKSKPLSRKERAKPLRVRALAMIINSSLPPQIHEEQVKALRKENIKDENLHGMDKEFETCLDGTLYIRSRSWLPRFRDLRELIMHESHKSNYSIHSKSDKIYHNLKQLYQWPIIEAGIDTYVSKCLAYIRMRDDYQKLSGLLVQP
ncbi:putative reverse transcriptase domain-containing protein [Tanacetum coccineum]